MLTAMKQKSKGTQIRNLASAPSCAVAVQCEALETRCVGTQCLMDSISRGVQCKIYTKRKSIQSSSNSIEKEAEKFPKPYTLYQRRSARGIVQADRERRGSLKIIESKERILKCKVLERNCDTSVCSTSSCTRVPSFDLIKIGTSAITSDASNFGMVYSSTCSTPTEGWNHHSIFIDDSMLKQNTEKFSTMCSVSKRKMKDQMSPLRHFRKVDHPCLDSMVTTPIKRRHSTKGLGESESSSNHRKRYFVKQPAFQSRRCVKRKLFTHSSEVFEPSPPNSAMEGAMAVSSARPAVESSVQPPYQQVQQSVTHVDQPNVHFKVRSVVEPRVQPPVQPQIENPGNESPKSFEYVCGSDSDSDKELQEKSLNGRLRYSKSERQSIVDYIVAKKLFSRVRGRRMWEEMESRKVCRGRTWQSMKEHFRKQIVPNIKTFQLPSHVVNMFSNRNG